ncbi:MAG: SPASM domain-containing protein [Nitrospirae bacterium]|nr:SPASM domain-containing protein [Nitrospirota bacterium]
MDLGLATHGLNEESRFKILKRHIYAFIKHFTIKKLFNFIKTEYNLKTKKIRLNSLPYILKLETTNICNFKCAYCYDGRRQPVEGERAFGRMSFDNFQKLIDDIGSYLFKINLYGFGEPFLFPETLDMIAYATKKNIGVGVSSNLNIDDDTLPSRIVESGLEVLIFSCHGVTQESYSKFMGKGNMELAFKNVTGILKERKARGLKTPFIDWQFCVTKFNQSEIPLAQKKASELGIDNVRFIKPFFPVSAEEDFISDIFPRKRLELSNHDNPGCSWPYRSVYINYDGGLLPCCKDTRLLSNDFGNVFRDGFKTIWNNDHYLKSRALIKDPANKELLCDTMCVRCPVTQIHLR